MLEETKVKTQESIASKFHRSWVIVVFEIVTFLSVIVTLWMFALDLQDRKKDQEIQAWQLVTTQAPGNSGKVGALEYLHSRGVHLNGIDVSPPAGSQLAFLDSLELPGAPLTFANFECTWLLRANFQDASLNYASFKDSYLWEANLRNSSLIEANMSGAFLADSDLSFVDLTEADLSSAVLRDSNLQGAILTKANLSSALLHHANLTDAVVSQEILNGACGNIYTKLDDGLTVPICGDVEGGPYMAKFCDLGKFNR